jgi:hypothetical protein
VVSSLLAVTASGRPHAPLERVVTKVDVAEVDALVQPADSGQSCRVKPAGGRECERCELGRMGRSNCVAEVRCERSGGRRMRSVPLPV